jgi:tetratricopeptide (TPR) repeat protein
MTLAIVMAGVGFVVLSGLAGCTRSSHRDQSQASPLIVPESPATSPALFTGANAVQPQALSLLAQPLYPPELPPEVRAQRQEQLYEAQLVYDRDPHDQDAIIWLGRRQAYLGDFRAAIDTFSNGLAIDPASYKLLRHRGHRFITLRDLDRAVADLSEAAAIIESANIADEVEPDGQPNDRNIPTSTSHTNIYYHLGLALYLQGDFAGAAEAWRKCLAFATNDDMRVAATYWRYLSLMRAAQDQQAQALLATVRPSMEIIENTSYHQLLLMFKEQAQPQALLPGDGVGGDVSVDVATIGYGLGVRELLLGNMLAARQHFQRVVAETNWAAFGHIAAEAELARGR